MGAFDRAVAARCGLLLLVLSSACRGDGDPPAARADAGADAAAPDGGDAAAPDAGEPVTLATPRIDALFDDWGLESVIARDPAGDATGAFDVTALSARSQGARLFLRFDVGERKNLLAGDDRDGTLRLEVESSAGRHLTIDHRALDPRFDGRALIWDDLSYEAAPTHSGTEFEIAMDLMRLGVERGDTITIDVDGSDALDAPVSFTLTEPAPEPVHRSWDRQDGTTVRIASLNVHKSGLLPGLRRDALIRLLRAAGADVVCLQEEYDLTEEDLVALFAEVSGEDEPWHVAKVRDDVVASRAPLVPLPGSSDRYVAVVVDLGEAGSLAVVSVHLSCCGYDGDGQDRNRIDETTAIRATLEDLRAHGDAAVRDAHVVVVGDWNLVGSRRPLEVLLDADGLDLEQWLLPHLVGEHVTTFRSAASPFPPGILDLVVHSRGLVRHNGFLLEERSLSDEERGQLSLEPEDGYATDHLPVVADFELPG